MCFRAQEERVEINKVEKKPTPAAKPAGLNAFFQPKKEDAMDLLSRQAFQQKAEAEGKWNRVQLTSVQLCSYFTGFYEIIQLRETYKKSKASAFNVKHFNEDFLGYGSSPVKYIRQMLLPKN